MLPVEDREMVEEYFRSWHDWVLAAADAGGLRKKVWREREPRPPIAAVKAAAREHPNARVRRDCLNVLDHHANDESAAVFAAALGDQVPRVREIALHGLSCERCRTAELCVDDVVPAVVTAIETDKSPKVRHDCVFILTRLASRDGRAAAAVRRAAESDADPLVRANALAAVEGRYRDMGSRKAMRRRARRRADPANA